MDPKERNDTLKSKFTYVCCGVFAVCLLLIMILLFKQNRKKLSTITEELIRKRNKITLNLSVCLLIVDLLIIFGMNKTNINPKVRK
jgi:cytochrome bd-type quinol oxidase subunit 2